LAIKPSKKVVAQCFAKYVPPSEERCWLWAQFIHDTGMIKKAVLSKGTKFRIKAIAPKGFKEKLNKLNPKKIDIPLYLGNDLF
jgi:hypothetical protein